MFPRVTLCDFEVGISDHGLKNVYDLGPAPGQRSPVHCTVCTHDQHVQRKDLSLPLVRCRVFMRKLKVKIMFKVLVLVCCRFYGHKLFLQFDPTCAPRVKDEAM